jgi:hypothetical protein
MVNVEHGKEKAVALDGGVDVEGIVVWIHEVIIVILQLVVLMLNCVVFHDVLCQMV